MVFRILAVCLVCAASFIAGGTLSGLNRIAQQVPQAAQTPESVLPAFLTLSVSVGIAVSYLILRSTWRGWLLAAAMGASMYGISTVATQIESVWFLSNAWPRGMIQALFLQGAIATALSAPLSVLLLGRWRTPPQRSDPYAVARIRGLPDAWRVALLVVAFVFLYMFFGYYVAWQSPAVRQFYGGPEYPGFFASLKANWMDHPWIYALQVIRALLYVACLYPLVRMLPVARWESALAMAFFLSVWSTALLLPNPLMPPDVAHAHLRETLGFSLVFGAFAGWLLGSPHR
jgi:hypothetical protein